MTHPLADPEALDIIARELHEHARRRIESFPAWEDLNMLDPWHVGLIQLAYDKARDFVVKLENDET